MWNLWAFLFKYIFFHLFWIYLSLGGGHTTCIWVTYSPYFYAISGCLPWHVLVKRDITLWKDQDICEQYHWGLSSKAGAIVQLTYPKDPNSCQFIVLPSMSSCLPVIKLYETAHWGNLVKGLPLFLQKNHQGVKMGQIAVFL